MVVSLLTGPTEKLGKQWYHLRTPLKACHTLSAKPSHLTLYGSPQSITDLESPCMLLRRQTAYNGTWRTRIEFDPADEWEEAGTTVFYSKWSYIALVIRRSKEGSKEVVVRWTDKSGNKLTDLIPAFLKPAGSTENTRVSSLLSNPNTSAQIVHSLENGARDGTLD